MNGTSHSEYTVGQSWKQPLEEERKPFTKAMIFIEVDFCLAETRCRQLCKQKSPRSGSKTSNSTVCSMDCKEQIANCKVQWGTGEVVEEQS